MANIGRKHALLFPVRKKLSATIVGNMYSPFEVSFEVQGATSCRLRLNQLLFNSFHAWGHDVSQPWAREVLR